MCSGGHRERLKVATSREISLSEQSAAAAGWESPADGSEHVLLQSCVILQRHRGSSGTYSETLLSDIHTLFNIQLKCGKSSTKAQTLSNIWAILNGFIYRLNFSLQNVNSSTRNIWQISWNIWIRSNIVAFYTLFNIYKNCFNNKHLQEMEECIHIRRESLNTAENQYVLFILNLSPPELQEAGRAWQIFQSDLSLRDKWSHNSLPLTALEETGHPVVLTQTWILLAQNETIPKQISPSAGRCSATEANVWATDAAFLLNT